MCGLTLQTDAQNLALHYLATVQALAVRAAAWKAVLSMISWHIVYRCIYSRFCGKGRRGCFFFFSTVVAIFWSHYVTPVSHWRWSTCAAGWARIHSMYSRMLTSQVHDQRHIQQMYFPSFSFAVTKACCWTFTRVASNSRHTHVFRACVAVLQASLPRVARRSRAVPAIAHWWAPIIGCTRPQACSNDSWYEWLWECRCGVLEQWRYRLVARFVAGYGVRGLVAYQI